MKKIFIYLIFFILFNNVSFAYFGKLKLICNSETYKDTMGADEKWSRSFEFIEKGDYLIMNSPPEIRLKKITDDSTSVSGVKKDGWLEFKLTILKNSLLYSFTRNYSGEKPWRSTERGKCEKL